MLTHLDFQFSLVEEGSKQSPVLQILTEKDADRIIGKEGVSLNQLEDLVNQLVNKHFQEAPTIRVDCQYYRADKEQAFIQEIFEKATQVKETGEMVKLRPLNAYYRRLVHQALGEDPQLRTVSPQTSQKMKQITISLNKSANS